MRLVFDRTSLLPCLLCLYYAYYACSLYYAYYTCIMPTIPVLCLLCLYYAYYACTMPTMPVLCLLCLYYACTMPTMPVLCLLCLYYAYYACTMPTMPVLCLFITTLHVTAHKVNTQRSSVVHQLTCCGLLMHYNTKLWLIG